MPERRFGQGVRSGLCDPTRDAAVCDLMHDEPGCRPLQIESVRGDRTSASDGGNTDKLRSCMPALGRLFGSASSRCQRRMGEQQPDADLWARRSVEVVGISRESGSYEPAGVDEIGRPR